MKDVVDLAGKRFGRLVILGIAHKDKFGNQLWKCVCDCENIVFSTHYRLRMSKVKSCGCFAKDIKIKHNNATGGKVTKEYKSWTAIKERCFNPNVKEYIRYGGVGITMCAEWINDFSAFLKEVGVAPSKNHTIDRYPNQAGNYEPGNVRWASKQQQAWNRRTNILIEYNGETKCLAAWANQYSIPYHLLWERINKRKIPFEKAISGIEKVVKIRGLRKRAFRYLN